MSCRRITLEERVLSRIHFLYSPSWAAFLNNSNYLFDGLFTGVKSSRCLLFKCLWLSQFWVNQGFGIWWSDMVVSRKKSVFVLWTQHPSLCKNWYQLILSPRCLTPPPTNIPTCRTTFGYPSSIIHHRHRHPRRRLYCCCWRNQFCVGSSACYSYYYS